MECLSYGSPCKSPGSGCCVACVASTSSTGQQVVLAIHFHARHELVQWLEEFMHQAQELMCMPNILMN